MSVAPFFATDGVCVSGAIGQPAAARGGRGSFEWAATRHGPALLRNSAGDLVDVYAIYPTAKWRRVALRQGCWKEGSKSAKRSLEREAVHVQRTLGHEIHGPVRHDTSPIEHPVDLVDFERDEGAMGEHLQLRPLRAPHEQPRVERRNVMHGFDVDDTLVEERETTDVIAAEDRPTFIC
jgi:hypothetical protein